MSSGNATLGRGRGRGRGRGNLSYQPPVKHKPTEDQDLDAAIQLATNNIPQTNAEPFENDHEMDASSMLEVQVTPLEDKWNATKIDPDEITFVDSNRGKHKKLLYQNYSYHFQKDSLKNGGGAFYTCVNSHKKGTEKCGGRALLNKGKLTLTKQHSHLEDGTKIDAALVRDFISKKAATGKVEPGKFTDATMRDVPDNVKAHFPKIPSIKKDAARKKLQKAVKEEHDLLKQPTSLWDFVVPEYLKKKVMYDAGPFHPLRFLVISTEADLRRLCMAEVVLGDGTFDVPKIFKKHKGQLEVLHGHHHNRAFPHVFALLPGKSRDLYYEFFLVVINLCKGLGDRKSVV